MLERIAGARRPAGTHAERVGRAHARLGGAPASGSSCCRRRSCDRVERLLGHRSRALRRRPQRLRPASASRRRAVDRAAFWRRALVDEPRGWLPGQEPGASRYAAPSVDASLARSRACWSASGASRRSSASALLVARLRACAGALRPRRPRSCSSAATRASGRASTRAWWRETGRARRLPGRLARPRRAARASAAPPTRSCSRRSASSSAWCWSRAMACGLPAIAVDRYGPADIVDARRDRAGSSSPTTRRGSRPRSSRRWPTRPSAPPRGRRPRDALARFAWPALGARLAELLDVVAAAPPATPPRPGREGRPRLRGRPGRRPRDLGRAGFAVDGAGGIELGGVTLRLAGRGAGEGLLGLVLDDAPRGRARRRRAAGARAAPVPRRAPQRRLRRRPRRRATPSAPRTARALQDAGLDLRATREVPLAPATGGPLHRPSCSLAPASSRSWAAPRPATPATAARRCGGSRSFASISMRWCAHLGPRRAARDAAQPGPRIATLAAEAGVACPVAVMTPRR